MTESGCNRDEPSRLVDRATTDMSIKGKRFRLWLADNVDDQDAGLMHVTADQMAPLPGGIERGMLFVFEHPVRGSFWMKNTIIPLDIAYVATDGTVVAIYTMVPLDTRSNAYPPGALYRFAIELSANRLSGLGVKVGDRLEIPPSILKRR